MHNIDLGVMHGLINIQKNYSYNSPAHIWVYKI